MQHKSFNDSDPEEVPTEDNKEEEEEDASDELSEVERSKGKGKAKAKSYAARKKRKATAVDDAKVASSENSDADDRDIEKAEDEPTDSSCMNVLEGVKDICNKICYDINWTVVTAMREVSVDGALNQMVASRWVNRWQDADFQQGYSFYHSSVLFENRCSLKHRVKSSPCLSRLLYIKTGALPRHISKYSPFAHVF